MSIRGTEYDRFAEIRRIEKIKYERTISEIADKHSRQPIHSSPIYTDRSTMERKSSSSKLVRKLTPNKTNNR